MNGGCDLRTFGCGEVERAGVAGAERDIARLAAKKAVTRAARRRVTVRWRLDINVEGEPYALRMAEVLRIGRRAISVRRRAAANICNIETRGLPRAKVNEAEVRRKIFRVLERLHLPRLPRGNDDNEAGGQRDERQRFHECVSGFHNSFSLHVYFNSELRQTSKRPSASSLKCRAPASRSWYINNSLRPVSLAASATVANCVSAPHLTHQPGSQLLRLLNTKTRSVSRVNFVMRLRFFI